MKYKGIIFDLDGVICFTDQYHYLAWKELADKLGIYFDEEINNRLRGVSRMESFEIILERYNGTMANEDKVKYADEKNNLYRKLLKQMSPGDVEPETRKTLDILKEKGYKLAIGSSSRNAKFILEKIGLGDFFHAISDGTDITKSKPDPEVFLLAAQMIDLLPKDCLVIEDALAGIDAAVAGGFDSVAIGDATKGNDATYKIEKFEEILYLVY